jgi:hypothetical protein
MDWQSDAVSGMADTEVEWNVVNTKLLMATDFVV